MNCKENFNRGFKAILRVALLVMMNCFVPCQVFAQQVAASDSNSQLNAVTSKLESAKFEEAEQAIAQLKLDATNAAESLCRIAQDYQRYNLSRSKELAEEVVKQYPDTLAAKKMQLLLWQYSIQELIENERMAEAETSIAGFCSTYSEQPQEVAKALIHLARQCVEAGRSDFGGSIYARVAREYPTQSAAKHAQLQVGQCAISYIIEKEGYPAAKEAIDKFRVNFAGQEKLVESLSDIASKYLLSGRYEQAAEMLADYKDSYPGDTGQTHVLMNLAAAKARLHDEAGVNEAMGQLITEFGTEDRLIVNAAYCVANHYRLAEDYDRELRFYTYVHSQWESKPPTFWQQWLALYTQVLVNRAGEWDEKLSQLIANCPEDAKASRGFYWLGNLFERIGDADHACQVYEAAINRWPTDQWSLSCQLLVGFLKPGLDDAARQAETAAFVDNYAGHRDFAVAVYRAACDIYRNADQNKQKVRNQAKNDYLTAIQCLNILDSQGGNRAALFIRQEGMQLRSYSEFALHHDAEAAAASEKYLAAWPSGSGSEYMNLMLGRSLQRQLRQHKIAEGEIAATQAKMESAYQAVVGSSAEAQVKVYAAGNLGDYYSQAGQYSKAAEVLEAGLTASPDSSKDYMVRNAAFTLSQAYQALGKSELSQDVVKQYLSSDSVVTAADGAVKAGSVLGGAARLTALKGE